jgi:hypothetical protein
LDDKTQELEKRPEIPDRHMYLAELRKLEKYRHPVSNEWVKTAVDRDLKDVVRHPPTHLFFVPQANASVIYCPSHF